MYLLWVNFWMNVVYLRLFSTVVRDGMLVIFRVGLKVVVKLIFDDGLNVVGDFVGIICFVGYDFCCVGCDYVGFGFGVYEVEYVCVHGEDVDYLVFGGDWLVVLYLCELSYCSLD